MIWSIWNAVEKSTSNTYKLNPLSANPPPHEMVKHTNDSLAVVDEFFDCVLPFCGLALKGLIHESSN